MSSLKSNILFRVAALVYIAYYFFSDPQFLAKELSSILKEQITFTEVESSVLGVLFTVLAVSDVIPYLEGKLNELKKVYIARLYIFGAIGASLTFDLVQEFHGKKLIQYYSFVEIITNALIVSQLNTSTASAQRDQEHDHEHEHSE